MGGGPRILTGQGVLGARPVAIVLDLQDVASTLRMVMSYTHRFSTP